MRKIVYYPNKILRVKTKVINNVDDKLLADVGGLVAVLKAKRQHAAGLAAVQIGMERRFFGLIRGDKRQPKVFINPKIVKVFGEKTRPMMVFDDNKKEVFFEGCLSFPDLFGTVKRYLKIEAVWDEIIDGQLEPQKETLEGIESIAYQHELDHLDGILFIDRIKEEKGELYEYVEDKKRKVDVEELVKLER